MHEEELETVDTLNPFSPGAGRPPKKLAGRTGELKAMRRMLVRITSGHTDRGMIFSGLRGMGKTVLLHRMTQLAKQSGIMTFRLEPSSDHNHDLAALARDLERSIRMSRHIGFRNRVGNVLERLQSLNTHTSRNIADSATPFADDRLNLESAIEELTENLAQDHSGLLLFVDEFQRMDERLMGTLVGLQHRLGQDMLPFYIIGTGLPNLPRILASTRSYTERLFEYRQIGRLSDEAVSQCLQETARQAGQRFTSEALDRLVLDTQGYPYYLQTYGEAAFNETTSNPIPLEAVIACEPHATRTLDNGLYDSRWQRADQLGRQYMHAMASLGTESANSSAIADVLRREMHDLEGIRKGLIELGLIYSSEGDKMSFTLPGMADYIQRNDPAHILPYDV